MDNISYSLPGTVVQSSYSIDGENLIITKGNKGVIVDKTEITNLIENLVIEGLKGEDVYTIEIPVIEAEPDPIDIDAIHDEIYKEPQDAYITQDPFQLFVHSNGVDFDVDAAKEIIQEEAEQYTIPLIITVPEITVDKLGDEAFPDLLGSYTTSYGASSSNRGINIAIAANTINGIILMPGEVFSYNQVIGDTTPDKGYKLGGSYLNGELVQSYGGGICQVSSTLYNTVLYANLEIVLRYNHSSTVGYVPASRDATVSYGGKDFKFKNSRNYPIKISATATNGVLKIEIYGIKEEEEYEVVIESYETGTIAYTTKYVEDSTLAEGQQVVSSSGSNGKRSVAYKVLKLNGVVVSKTLLSQDTYNPMQRIVKVGTKKN
jgi:vancomycin resistance protein YoaR